MRIPCRDCLILPICREKAKKYAYYKFGMEYFTKKCSKIAKYIEKAPMGQDNIDPDYQAFKYLETGFLYTKWLNIISMDGNAL